MTRHETRILSESVPSVKTPRGRPGRETPYHLPSSSFQHRGSRCEKGGLLLVGDGAGQRDPQAIGSPTSPSFVAQFSLLGVVKEV